MSDNLDKLYEYYNQLDSAKDDIAKVRLLIVF